MEEQTRQLTFHDLIDIVSRRRWFVAITVVVVGVAGTLFALAKPDEYTARSVFLVKDPTTVAELYGSALVSVPFTRRMATIQEDVRAYENARGVVEDLSLARGGKSVDTVVRSILDSLSLEILTSSRGDTTVVMEVTDTSPSVAAGVANSLRERYINGMVGGYLEQVRRIVDQARTNVEKIEEAQGKKLEAIEVFEDRHLLDVYSKISKTEADVQRIERELGQLDQKILLRRQEIDRLDDEVSRLDRVDEKPKREENPRWKPLAEKVLTAQRAVNELEELYTEEYPPLVEARKQLEEAKAKLDEEERYTLREVERKINAEWRKKTDRIAEARGEIAAMEERGRSLRNEKRSLDRTVAELPRLKNDYAQLELGLDRGQQALAGAVAEQRRAEYNYEIASESAQLFFETVDEARVPRSPSGPNRALWILGSIAFGLGMSVAVCVVLHFLSRSIGSVTEAKTLLDVPILGTVQSIRSQIEVERSRRRKAMAGVLGILVVFTGATFLLVYTQFPELLPGFVRDSITAFRERIR